MSPSVLEVPVGNLATSFPVPSNPRLRGTRRRQCPLKRHGLAQRWSVGLAGFQGTVWREMMFVGWGFGWKRRIRSAFV
jgi:hypothetical protein